MSNTAPMSDLQRSLWLAWYEEERKVSHLTGSKPQYVGDKGNDGDRERREAHRDAVFAWREDWNQAIGYRDGMRSACVIAGVPNFKDD